MMDFSIGSSKKLKNMSSDKQKRVATRVLCEQILSGEVNKEQFTRVELLNILQGKARIGDYTWHHHQDVGRMQLVPTEIHRKVWHIGGRKLWIA